MLSMGASAMIAAAVLQMAPAAVAEDGANPVTGTDGPLTLAQPTGQEGVRLPPFRSFCQKPVVTSGSL